MIYLTSDWHLDHWADWLQKQRWEFDCVHEMNGVLLSNAMRTVGPTDVLYVLGDFAWRPDTFKGYAASLEAMCEVRWVQGNHDPKYRRDPLALDFKHNKKHYYVCHYPWQSFRPNTVMLHGHTHARDLGQSEDTRQRARYDVGVDTEWGGRKYFPVSIEQIEERMQRDEDTDHV